MPASAPDLPPPAGPSVPESYEWRDGTHTLPGALDLHFGGRLERVEVA